jgi:hypothetical protein
MAGRTIEDVQREADRVTGDVRAAEDYAHVYYFDSDSCFGRGPLEWEQRMWA